MRLTRREFLKMAGAAAAVAAVPALPLRMPEAVGFLEQGAASDAAFGAGLARAAADLSMAFRVAAVSMQCAADAMVTMQVQMEAVDGLDRVEITMETLPGAAAFAIRPGDLVNVDMNLGGGRGPINGSQVDVSASRDDGLALGPVRELKVSRETAVYRLSTEDWQVLSRNEVRRRLDFPTLEDL